RPGAEARPTAEDAAGVHLTDAADVVETVGVAGADDGEVVGAGGDLRIPVADPQTGLAVLLELALGAEQRREGGLAHRRDGTVERVGQRFAVELRQFRLGIEEVNVTRAA